MASFDLGKLKPKPHILRQDEKYFIARGGTATVYRSWYDGVPVAVKISGVDLQEEFKIMKTLNHPNLVKVIGFSAAEGLIVMELAKGSLQHILADSTQYPDSMITWDLKLSIALGVAEGLKYCHSQEPRIIHRDLTSNNVMIREDWSAFLVDFGIAKKQLHTTQGTKFLGTPYWTAPEMFDSEALTTPALDIYGFAMVLYELLTRKLPKIAGISATGERPVIPDSAIIEGSPIGYLDLMKSCWDQDAKKRPSLKAIISHLRGMNELKSMVKFLMENIPVILPKDTVKIVSEYIFSTCIIS